LAFLELTYQLASEAYERNPNDQEAVFFCISSLGFLAAYENDYKNYVKAVNHTRKAYTHLKIGLRNTERQPEFLYSAGIYNFYRIVYPELHAAIRPFMVFFEDGNKRLGLAQLDAAIRKSVFVKNESTFYLAYVYNKYEGTPAKGLPFSEMLVDKYPENHLFMLQRAELLTLAGQYEAAEVFINRLEKTKSPYMIGAAQVFRGMREEFERKRFSIAESYYGKAMQQPWEERFTKDIHGLALMGIARIENRKGNKGKALNWAQKAADFVEYKNSIEEQKRLVNAYGK
jgi:tetratricopeptide (TPR) repeat protein